MAVLLSFIVTVVVLGLLFLAFKRKKLWPLALAAVFMVVYMNVQPSYLPKGEVKRSVIPAFEKSDAKIQDNLLKPPSGEDMDRERNQQIKEGLPFKQH